MSGIGKPLVSANGGIGKIVEGPPEGTPRGLGDAMRRLIDFSEKVKSDHSPLFYFNRKDLRLHRRAEEEEETVIVG